MLTSVKKFILFGDPYIEKDRYAKESTEISYLTNCIKLNRKTDSLIEFKSEEKGEIESIFFSNGKTMPGYSFEYKDMNVYFTLDTNKKVVYLKEINYFKNSFNKIIFLSDSVNNYEITNNSKFKVFMSLDKRSIYFCLINSEKLIVWVLSNGNKVYSTYLELK